MENLKKILKKSRFFVLANQEIKSFLLPYKNKKLERKYSQIAAKYPNISNPLDYYLKRLSQRMSQPPRKKMGNLNIFNVGALESQDKSGYIQALEKFGSVRSFYNQKGQYGPEYWFNKFDEKVRKRNSSALFQGIERAEHEIGKIDLIIGQMWANYLPVETLQKLQEAGKIVLNIAMDDRGVPELWEERNGILMGAIGLANGTDLVLNTSKECCPRYLLHGAACEYFPLASDPEIFYPAKNKDIDVSFVGSCYGVRKKYIDTLKKSGINVKVFGPGWSDSVAIGHDQVADVFSRSKIIFGIGTVGYTKNVFTMKLRDFDAPMSGSLYLTTRNPDLYDIFVEGKEILYYRTPEEAAQIIIELLSDRDRLTKLGENARAKAIKEHTWEKRFKEIFARYSIIEQST